MIHKRPLDNEGVYVVACKNPRHWDNNGRLAPLVDLVPTNGVDGSCENQVGASLSEDSIKEALSESVNGFDEQFWWANSDIIQCNMDFDAPINLSFFPDFFFPIDQLQAFIRSDKICSYPVDCDSPRLVSVGPDHQADIPEWVPQGITGHNVDKSYEERLMGTCVIPMPEFEACSDNDCTVCELRAECDCPDHGSIRCVRQHVTKSREDLKRNLGEKNFEALGFGNMGEYISENWTEEEEQTFFEVVRSNPVRSGKNFWNKLSEVFQSRTKKDLVGYYFNVFMLWKRMEQNRIDPLNIDSDDDE